MLFQEFGALEAGRQLLLDGLGDHPGAGEADQRAGLGQVDVPQHRVGSRDPSRRGVGEDRNVGQAALVEPGQHRGRLGHLHEGEDSLHHARTPRCGHHNQGKLALQRVPSGTSDLLAHDRPHRPTDEAEIHHGQSNRDTLDASPAGDDGFVPPRPVPGRSEPVAVGLEVGKVEGVAARHAGVLLFEGIRVGQKFNVTGSRNPKVIPALRAHAQVSRQPLAVEDLSAAVTLLEDVLRDIPAVLGSEALLLLSEPGQICPPLALWIRYPVIKGPRWPPPPP